MEELELDDDVARSKKKMAALSLIALGALAAGGEGVRRRRANDSTDWARKGLVIVLVLAILAALETKRRRSKASNATSNGSLDEGDAASRIAPTRVASAN